MTDIERTAWEFWERHGDKAPIHTAMEADACLEAGDMDGATHWRLVRRAIRGMVEPEGSTH